MVKEVWRSKLGKIGLVLFALMIFISLYVWLTFPDGYGKKIWNNPAYWADYPKNAAPAWTKFFGGNKSAHTVKVIDSVEPERSYQFETVGRFSLSVSDVTFWGAPPVIEIFSRKENQEILLRREVVPESRVEEQKPAVRYQEYPLRIDLDKSLTTRVVVHLADERDRVGELKFVTRGDLFGLLGTDSRGRDIFQGILYGLPIALLIALSTSLAATIIGAGLAGISGYYGGKTDSLIQRAIDVIANFPLFPILIFLVFVLGPHLFYIVLILIVFGWTGISLKLRPWVFQIKASGFVEYARARGFSSKRIIIRHILSQTLPYLLVSVILAVPLVILAEAGLSFLGLGDPSLPTWGQMLEQSYNTGAVYLGYWWQVLPPGLAIIGTIVVFWFILQALEPIVEPRLKGG